VRYRERDLTIGQVPSPRSKLLWLYASGTLLGSGVHVWRFWIRVRRPRGGFRLHLGIKNGLWEYGPAESLDLSEEKGLGPVSEEVEEVENSAESSTDDSKLERRTQCLVYLYKKTLPTGGGKNSDPQK
jgi:hypothetical protein